MMFRSLCTIYLSEVAMKRVFWCAIALGAVACVHATPLSLGPATGTGPVVCDSGCASEWQRAQLWVAKHSRWKIQTATDVLLQTYNPSGYEPTYGFTATKEPLVGGKYRISLAMDCGNPLGCDSRREDIQAAFYYYVATGNDVLAGQRVGGIR
jgi:hypothetical protein